MKKWIGEATEMGVSLQLKRSATPVTKRFLTVDHDGGAIFLVPRQNLGAKLKANDDLWVA